MKLPDLEFFRKWAIKPPAKEVQPVSPQEKTQVAGLCMGSLDDDIVSDLDISKDDHVPTPRVKREFPDGGHETSASLPQKKRMIKTEPNLET